MKFTLFTHHLEIFTLYAYFRYIGICIAAYLVSLNIEKN